VERKDSDEGSFKCVKHAGLDLRRAGKAARLGHHDETLRAEFRKESRQRIRFDPGRNHTVVVAGDRENGSGIIPIVIVELIEVKLGFAEVVNDVAQEQAELRNFLGDGFVEIAHHFVCDLFCVFGPFVLPQSPFE
jgi:hypothetical protein